MKGTRCMAMGLLMVSLPVTMLLCVCVGSVWVPPIETLSILRHALHNASREPSSAVAIILSVRLPRVLCVALSGASLSLCGVAMQGLLRNPLADGSTLGVSSGASLGAVVSIVMGINIPFIPLAGTACMAILFAFLSLVLILSLAYVLDRSLSTSGIILIGVIFSMFVSSLLSLLIAFSGDKLRSV